MSEQILGFLGLMRRAGALAVGAEDAFDAARQRASPQSAPGPGAETPAPEGPKVPQRAAGRVRGSKSRASPEKGGTELW